MTGDLVCPGCGRAKTKRAELCAHCRRIANNAGTGVVLERITPSQTRAFHAISNAIDKLKGDPIGTAKARVKNKNRIATVRLMSSVAASELLDDLDEEREALKEERGLA